MNSIASVVGIASELPLYINDSRGITVSGIASECRQIKAKEGRLGLVVVDYLQMMAEDSGGNRSYELRDVARGLYKLAGNLSIERRSKIYRHRNICKAGKHFNSCFSERL